MREARHLHPEWGILAPPPSFSRAIRVFVIATIVGATAASAVVLALADRMPDQMSVAARTLTTSTEAVAIQVPPVLTAPFQVSAALTGARAKSPGIIDAAPPKPVASSTPAQKKANKKHHTGTHYASRGRQFTSLMDDWYHAVGL